MYCAAVVRSVLRASSLLCWSEEIVVSMVWSWWVRRRLVCVSDCMVVVVMVVLLGSWDDEGLLGLEWGVEGWWVWAS